MQWQWYVWHFSSYSIMRYFRYLGNPINDRVQFLRSSENLWRPGKGFISCDNKIGLGKAIPLYLCTPTGPDISVDWSPVLLWYEIWGQGNTLKILGGLLALAAEKMALVLGIWKQFWDKDYTWNFVLFQFELSKNKCRWQWQLERNPIYGIHILYILFRRGKYIDVKILALNIKTKIHYFFLCSMSVKSCQFLSKTFFRSDLGIPRELLGIGVESSWRGGCTYLQSWNWVYKKA